jgi:hypothetical protein
MVLLARKKFIACAWVCCDYPSLDSKIFFITLLKTLSWVLDASYTTFFFPKNKKKSNLR